MADLKLKEVDTLPATLAERSAIIYDGQIWIGNSSNEPVPSKGYKEYVGEFSLSEGTLIVDDIISDIGSSNFVKNGNEWNWATGLTISETYITSVMVGNGDIERKDFFRFQVQGDGNISFSVLNGTTLSIIDPSAGAYGSILVSLKIVE